jgi:hypothetical protein
MTTSDAELLKLCDEFLNGVPTSEETLGHIADGVKIARALKEKLTPAPEPVPFDLSLELAFEPDQVSEAACALANVVQREFKVDVDKLGDIYGEFQGILQPYSRKSPEPVPSLDEIAEIEKRHEAADEMPYLYNAERWLALHGLEAHDDRATLLRILRSRTFGVDRQHWDGVDIRQVAERLLYSEPLPNDTLGYISDTATVAHWCLYRIKQDAQIPAQKDALAKWLHGWFSKNGISAYLDHMPAETPDKLAQALIDSGLLGGSIGNAP